MNQVLIIDQSPCFRQKLASVLQSFNFSVVEAEDGLEAQVKFAEYLPDLVITDTIVPSLNGYQFCTWLRNHPHWNQVPVVFCSNRNTEFDRMWGLKKGANAYVVKSAMSQELPPILAMLLRSEMQVKQVA
ncbi:response regulator [Spirulina subsalsa]|uniref:response regulator n=1 Tax=Spirulina subsalsa TaxID=54311 RepID=UPI0002FDDA9B|nr:response regulator [Spirulina subsalsa]